MKNKLFASVPNILFGALITIAPLQMPIRKVGTASSSRASAAAAILRPMRICGATNKATTPNTRMTTPMPVAACCE